MERSSLRFDEAKGPKLLPRFVVYITLAAGLMVADYRFSLMQPVRAAVMPMLYPVQWLANQPVQLYQYFADLSQSKSELLEQNRRLLEENGRLKIDLQRDKVNTDELRELKKLYGLQQKGIHNVIGAEVISNGKDPLSERLIIGKGSQDGLKVGDAVIDQSGLIGLLTQVHTQSAEIGLISGGQSIVPIAAAAPANATWHTAMATVWICAISQPAQTETRRYSADFRFGRYLSGGDSRCNRQQGCPRIGNALLRYATDVFGRFTQQPFCLGTFFRPFFPTLIS